MICCVRNVSTQMVLACILTNSLQAGTCFYLYLQLIVRQSKCTKELSHHFFVVFIFAWIGKIALCGTCMNVAVMTWLLDRNVGAQ